MKPHRILISAVLSVSVLLSAFTSCAKQNDEKNLPETKLLENYFTSKDISMPEGVLYADSVNFRSDNIYLSCVTQFSEPKRTVYSFDISEKTLNEEEMLSDTYITAMYMNNGKIYTCSREGDVSVNGKKEFSVPLGKSANSFYENENGELVIIFSDSRNYFSANIYDSSTYELKDEFDIPEICGLDIGTSALNLLYKDGSFLLISERYDDEKRINDLYVISDKKEIISKHENILPDTTGYYETSYINNRDDLCIIFRSFSDSTVSIDEINTSNGTRVNTYEDDFPSMTFLVTPHSPEMCDFLYWSDGKIYGYDADNVKRYEYLDRSDEENYLSNCYHAAVDGKNILLYSVDMRTQDTPAMFVLDKDGKQINKIMSSEYTETGTAKNIFLLSDGKMCVMESGKEKYYLRIIDENGNKINSISPCSESDEILSCIAGAGQNGEIYFVQRINDKDGRLIKISVFDESGNILRETSMPEPDGVSVKGAFGYGSDDFLFYDDSAEYSTSFASVIDYENGALKEKLMEGICGVCENNENSLCYYTYEGAYTYDTETGNSKEAINWSESDIVKRVYAVCSEDKDRFICLTLGKRGYELLHLDRADEMTLEKLRNREVIKLAGVDLNLGDILSEVEDFNSREQKYRIQVTDYMKYSSGQDYGEGIKKLNLDIVSGKAPDILIGDADLDLKLYASKNMFADLNEYIEKDEDTSRSDYLENILDCFAEDGKQVMFPLRFRLFTPVGKASVLGEKQGWTYEEFFGFAEKGSVFYHPSDRFLSEVLIYSNITEFVDYKEKTCDFDGGLFKRVIEYISENGIPYEEALSLSKDKDDDLFRMYCNRFKDDLCFAENLNTSYIRSASELQNGDMGGEKIAYKGVPTSSGNGVLAVPYPLVAISEKSQNKDGAWQFVKQLISDEYQDRDYSIPVKRSAFEKYLKKSNTTGFGDRPDRTRYVTDPFTDEDLEKFSEAVQNIDHIYTTDTTVNGIIEEQLALYLAGEQTSAETAANVQNKVSRYLNEIK